MYFHKLTQELARNKDIFKGLLTGLSEEEYMWKPEPNKWCTLEIVCHLYDEEREDFRARTKHVLETPDKPFIPIDPEGWVKERKYIQQDYSTSLEKFLQERDNSVQWLKSLTSPKWDNVYHHPKIGPMSAKMIFSNWVAHDYLHFRQIIQLKFNRLQELSGETLSYAGIW